MWRWLGGGQARNKGTSLEAATVTQVKEGGGTRQGASRNRARREWTRCGRGRGGAKQSAEGHTQPVLYAHMSMGQGVGDPYGG